VASSVTKKVTHQEIDVKAYRVPLPNGRLQIVGCPPRRGRSGRVEARQKGNGQVRTSRTVTVFTLPSFPCGCFYLLLKNVLGTDKSASHRWMASWSVAAALWSPKRRSGKHGPRSRRVVATRTKLELDPAARQSGWLAGYGVRGDHSPKLASAAGSVGAGRVPAATTAAARPLYISPTDPVGRIAVPEEGKNQDARGGARRANRHQRYTRGCRLDRSDVRLFARPAMRHGSITLSAADRLSANRLAATPDNPPSNRRPRKATPALPAAGTFHYVSVLIRL